MPGRVPGVPTVRFELFQEFDGATGWSVVARTKGHGMVIVQHLTRGRAKVLAGAFNREFRAATFKPKSAGRRARSKGHSFERWVAELLRPIFPEARRQLEYHADDANGVDIQGTGAFKIQCKKTKSYSPITCIEEIQCDEELGDIPVLVTAGDNKRPVAVLPFEYLLDLMRYTRGGR